MSKTWLEEIGENNAAYVQTPEAGRFTRQLLPGNRVLFTCMDPRVRVEAIGADRPNEEGMYTRIVLTPGGKFDYRAALILCYLADMKEFAIMLHTDCGQTKIFKDPERLIGRLKERLGEEGFKRAKALIGEPLPDKLRAWLDVFDDPYEEVRRQVEAFKNHPLIPPDVIVHGLVQDIFTGKVEVVVNGYEEAET
jgi:carbonic anhydrase